MQFGCLILLIEMTMHIWRVKQNTTHYLETRVGEVFRINITTPSHVYTPTVRTIRTEIHIIINIREHFGL